MIRFLGFLLILFLPLTSLAEVVRKVEFHGNLKSDDSYLYNEIKLKEGEEFSRVLLNNDIKSLYSKFNFVSVDATFEDGNLRFDVVEGKIINKVKIKGNKVVFKSKLFKNLVTKQENIYNKSDIAKDVLFLRYVYHAKGMPDTDVTYDVIDLGNGYVDIIFYIKEVPGIIVHSINFKNNDSFDEPTLLFRIASRKYEPYNLFMMFSKSHYFVRDRLPADVEMLTSFYKSRGFIDFQVKDVELEQLDTENVNITFVLSEGKRYKFGTSTIRKEGISLDYSSIDINNDGFFSPYEVNNTVQKIINFSNENGLSFINVRPSYTYQNDTVNITYIVYEEAKVIFNNIRILGNYHTNDAVIRSEIEVAPGDPYSEFGLHKSRQKILNLGFFESVDVVKNYLNNKLLDVDFELRERSTTELTATMSYNLATGLAGNISVTDINLLGTGIQASIALQVATKEHMIGMNYVLPHIFGSNVSIGKSLTYSVIDHEEESSYLMKVLDSGVNLSFKLLNDLYSALSINFRSLHSENANPYSSPVIRDESGHYTSTSVGYHIYYNDMNIKSGYDYDFGKEGTYLDLSQQVALFGTDRYFKSSFLAKHITYVDSKFSDDIRLGAKVDAGYIFGYNDHDILTHNRFFLGGNQIRGFATSGIGPRDVFTTDSIGGNIFLASSIQTDFPIGLPKGLGIRGSLFVDAGMLTDFDRIDKYLHRIKDSSSLRISTGFGLSMSSPFGIFRIDFGYPIKKEDFDKTETFRFTIVKELF